MKEAARELRQAEIETAAYALLEIKGYAGTTIQAVAKSSRASNETLYRWYGDKLGLFRALIARNTETLKQTLSSPVNDASPAMDVLSEVGPILLGVVLGERAVALNRAAAADASGDLGRALAQGGRDVVAPMIFELISKAIHEGSLAQVDPRALGETYLSLLIGDQQIRRVTGAMPAPTPDQNTARSDRALKQLVAIAEITSREAGPAAAHGLGLDISRRPPR